MHDAIPGHPLANVDFVMSSLPLRPKAHPFGKVLPAALFFLSGAFALVYEVLWMRELSLLFGTTAHAASVTLAAFFSGLAAGGWYWGSRSPCLTRPLMTYGLMELGVALGAAGCLGLLPVFRAIYPDLFELCEGHAGLFLAVKFSLSFMVLFPAAFLIGGTLPVISRAVVHGRDDFPVTASLLYGVNTVGAAMGALIAGFWLPVWLGYRGAYLATMGMSAAVGLTAFLAGQRSDMLAAVPQEGGEEREPWRATDTYAFLSGFAVLGLEVLWTRMFAQVLQNSVYTFSLIMTVCVLGLAIGALLANRLLCSTLSRDACLYFALILAGILVALTPHAFVAWTDSLRYVGQGLGWRDYLLRVAGLMSGVLGPALVGLGVIFPLLFAVRSRSEGHEGRALGRLLLINTLGAVCGALAAGFYLLDRFGLWGSIRLLAMLYLLAALAGTRFRKCALGWQRALPLAGALLLVSFLDTSRLPIVRVDPLLEGESLLQVWESHAGVVAVVRHGDNLKIKLDNHYTLGGSGSAGAEALQGSLPVLLHARPETVFALGLGTGITAGATLRHPIRRLEVAELLPAAIDAARLYFAPYHFGLFADPRTRVLEDDGRHFIAATRRHFDVILGDLFVPWQAGAGNLYTLEHFTAVRAHLNAAGLFMQWLPAYQLSGEEFAMIAKTLLAVFPQVTLWRGDFSTRTPVLGLLGHVDRTPLPPDVRMFSSERDAVDRGGKRLLMHYVGRLDAMAESVENAQLNSDDRPVIEYRSPITQRRQKLGETQWLTGTELIRLMEKVRVASGMEADPYLAELPESIRRLPQAGLCRHRAEVEKQEGYLLAAEQSRACADAIMKRLMEDD